MVVVRRIRAEEGASLRDVRLAALAEAPGAFASSYEKESIFTPDEWARRAAEASAGALRATFLAESGDRAQSTRAMSGGGIVGLVGGFRAAADEPEVHLVSMWTDPAVRRSGVGQLLIGAVVDWARRCGAGSVGLWVVDGNSPADNLYRKLGFVEAGDHQPVPGDPSRGEQKLRLVF